MAKPILLEMPPRDPRAELQAKLDEAPIEHAEALLSGYEVLQGLHDAGALEILRGLLGSRDKVAGVLVDVGKSPGSVRVIRNAVILLKALSAIDPEQLQSLTNVIPPAVAAATCAKKKLACLRERLDEPGTHRNLLVVVGLLAVLKLWRTQRRRD